MAITTIPYYHFGSVMPINNDWPLISAGKAQEPIDS